MNYNGIYIIGAGGHGQVIADILRKLHYPVKGFLDDKLTSKIMDIPIVGPIMFAKELEGRFVVAIGDNKVRSEIVKKLSLPDDRYFTVIHPSTVIGNNVEIGPGTMIIGGVIINIRTKIGKHVIVNTSSSLDHHNIIGDFVHIGPGTHTGGNVVVEEGAFLGIGTSVIPGKKIGKWAKIGAGAVVIDNIPPYTTSVGVPARVIKNYRND